MPVRTITPIRETSSDRRGGCSTSTRRRSISAGARGPMRHTRPATSLCLGGGGGPGPPPPAEPPAVNIFSELTDAIFEPLAARQQVVGARLGASATANNILLEVAQRYFELLAADADLRVRRESATQEAEVARLTRAY